MRFKYSTNDSGAVSISLNNKDYLWHFLISTNYIVVCVGR